MRKARYLWTLKIVLLSACADANNAPPVDSGVAQKDALSENGEPLSRKADFYFDENIAPDSRRLSEWQEMYNVSGAKIYGIWGSSSSNVFAVGAKGVIMRYDGKTWIQMTSGTENNLYGIWGFSPSDIYAVGESVILRYDGQQWKRIKFYPSNLFLSVWGLPPDELWIGAPGGIIFYKIGRDTMQMVDLPAGYSVYYYAVWGLPTGEVLAAGENGKALIGKGFSFSPMPETGIKTSLRGIWGSAIGDIYMVGENGMLIHYDGLAWNKVSISDSYFYGIWGSAADNVFVVGHPFFKLDESIFRYDGKKWAKMPPPTPSFLNAIYGFSDRTVFVVGDYNILKRISF